MRRLTANTNCRPRCRNGGVATVSGEQHTIRPRKPGASAFNGGGCRRRDVKSGKQCATLSQITLQ
jgi:hypothetical protein